MKIFIIAVIVGVSEILAITILHTRVGLLNSIYLYLAGTLFGGFILFTEWKGEVSKFKRAGEMDREWLQRLYADPKSFSRKDADNLRSLYEPILFFIAVGLICVPGVITDIIGILLALAPMRKFLVQQSIKGYERRSNA